MHKSNKKDGEFYCLQPIVIKRNGEKCEVIDGQQRLTTIMIIQKILSGDTYSIEYATQGVLLCKILHEAADNAAYAI